MWSPGVRDWHPLLISTSTRPDQQFPGQVQGSIAGITKGLAPPGSWKPVGKRLLHSDAERLKMFKCTTLPDNARLADPQRHRDALNGFRLRIG